MTAQLIHFGSPWYDLPDMDLPPIVTELEAVLLRAQAYDSSFDHPSVRLEDGRAWYRRQVVRIADRTVQPIIQEIAA